MQQLKINRFSDLQSVRETVRNRMDQWKRQARGRFMTTVDQDFPNESFLFYPPELEGPHLNPPLILIGGMGPLAGIRAFEKACSTIANKRLVFLYQACSVPNRTEVISKLAKKEATSQHRVLVRELAEAIQIAKDVVEDELKYLRAIFPQLQNTDIILVCNSAHFFMPQLRQELERTDSSSANFLAAKKVRFISLVVEATKKLASQFSSDSNSTLLCGTQGTLLGRCYAKSLADKEIPFQVPDHDAQVCLMSAIYRGIKAFDDQVAVDEGNKFLRLIRKSKINFQTLLAACTEIPFLLELMAKESRTTVSELLGPVELIDPVKCVFNGIDSNSENRTTSLQDVMTPIGAEE